MNQSLLSRSQHAFIRSKSVESVLDDVTLLRRIRLGRSKLSALLDIEGTFNNVTTTLMEILLRDIIDPDFLVWFITYVLCNRLVRIWIGVLSLSV